VYYTIYSPLNGVEVVDNRGHILFTCSYMIAGILVNHIGDMEKNKNKNKKGITLYISNV